MEWKEILKEYKRIDRLVDDFISKATDADLLTFGKYSAYDYIDFHNSDDDNVEIVYVDNGYDVRDENTIIVPTNILFNPDKWDEYIQNKVDEKLKRKEEERKRLFAEQERVERLTYERLKKKFG